jgi:hypothetical protein
MLSDRFCDEAGVPHGTLPAAFVESLRGAQIDCLDGLVATNEGKDAAIASLADLSRYEVRVVRQLAGVQEKYCKVHIEGEATPVLVAMLGDCAAASFPTDMENLILWGMLQPTSPIGMFWFDGLGGRVLDWRRRSKGLAVVALPLPIRGDDVARTVAALLGLEDGGLGSTTALAPVAAVATELHVGAPTRSLSQMQARLFFEAVATSHPKWRFLSFYRILENAYLTNIKDVLIAEFDKDAARAVEEAKKKLQSEANQLVDLMVVGRLEAEFLAFNAEFDNLMVAMNQYVIALDRASQGDQLYRENSKKAVLRFYKMRCSIAHAGTSSVIFEQMPDSIAAMILLLPSVEALVLKSLAITTR